MKIVPLTEENLEETIALAHKVFPWDAESEDPPERDFRKSLALEAGEKSWAGITKGKTLNRPNYLNYWALLDEDTGVVIGVTGLYSFVDAPTEAWLGWFGLDSSARGKGLGRKLLEWTMNKAKEEGYKIFKLYTSDDPSEAAAQNLYESLGLKVIRTEKSADGEYEVMYRQVNL